MNPHKGEVSFDADGKRYVMQFNVDVICSLEAETGKGIVALLGDLRDPQQMSLTRVRQILWAGLLEHQPEITIKEAGELIPAAGGLQNVVGMFEKSFSAAFPPPDKNARPRKAGSPRSGTGPHSISTGAASGATTNHSGERHHDK